MKQLALLFSLLFALCLCACDHSTLPESTPTPEVSSQEVPSPTPESNNPVKTDTTEIEEETTATEPNNPEETDPTEIEEETIATEPDIAQETESPANEEAPAPTEEKPMAAPALGEGPDGPEVMIFTDYYTLYLPKEWCDTCVYKVTPLLNGGYSLSIYETQSFGSFGGGNLCSLMMMPTDDDTYKDFPDYELLCALDTPKGSFYVVALFPTDVQFNEETMGSYKAMADELMDVLWTIHPNNGIEMSMP